MWNRRCLRKVVWSHCGKGGNRSAHMGVFRPTGRRRRGSEGVAGRSLPWETRDAPKELRAGEWYQETAPWDPECLLVARQPSLQTQEGELGTVLRLAWRLVLPCAGSLFPFFFLLFTVPLSLWHRWFLLTTLCWLPEFRISCTGREIEYWEAGRDRRKSCSVFTRKELPV